MVAKTMNWVRKNIAVLAFLLTLLAAIAGWSKSFIESTATASMKAEISRIDTRDDGQDTTIQEMQLSLTRIDTSLGSIDTQLGEIKQDVRDLRGGR